jgi:acyl carrier protein
MTYTREQIEATLRDIIAQQLHIEPDTIVLSATLTSMGADSLDVVEVIMKVEDHFGIEITDTAAENMHTLGDVVDYVEKHQS